jgi:hypothetical protein
VIDEAECTRSLRRKFAATITGERASAQHADDTRDEEGIRLHGLEIVRQPMSSRRQVQCAVPQGRKFLRFHRIAEDSIVTSMPIDKNAVTIGKSLPFLVYGPDNRLLLAEDEIVKSELMRDAQ